MKQVSMVVKGTLEQASREAIKRGVYCTRGNPTDDVALSVLWSDERYLPEISAWYADHGELIPGEGYPRGTCLIYSVHDPVDVYRDAVQDANWKIEVQG